MKRILVIAFAVSSLLKPSLVLCVESGGDVRVERPSALCCESSAASLPLALDHSATDDCDGCLDFSLATHSLTSKRTTVDDLYVTGMPAFLCVMPSAAASALPATLAMHRSSLFLATATTVLRR
jgi:hypothetical protein